MNEDIATYNTTTVPATNGDLPLPKRNGSRGLLPGSWLGRAVRLSYTDVHGKGVETSGTLLDYCGTEPIFNLGGARMVLAWDRLVLELVND